MMRDTWHGCVRGLAAVLVMAVSPIAAPQTQTAVAALPARAAPPASCDTVDELSSGYIPLYELNLPGRAYWPGGKTVPYALNRSKLLSSRQREPYLDRVAYCLDTVTRAGSHEWAYASFDAFTNNLSRLGVPSATIAQPVKRLTTWGSHVKHVEQAPGGYIEFWPNAYDPAASRNAPTGDSTVYDFSDTPRGSAPGYGSMQVHNTAAKETVLALNGWNRGSGRFLDIGTGNQKTGQPDWTFSQSGRDLASARLTVWVKPATPNASTCEQTVSELADYRLLYDVAVPQTAAVWAHGIPYAVDNAKSIRTPISRVAYCLDGMYGTDPAWGYASMNTWTQDLTTLGVPMTGAYGRRVTGLTVRGSDVAPADNSTGYLEIWPNRYSPRIAQNAPAGGSNTTYDFADTPQPVAGPIPGAGGYGSFQVHDVTHRRTVLAVNGWAAAPQTRLSAGIGNASTGQPDWTQAANARNWTRPHLKVYVRPAGVDITSGPTNAQLYPRDHATNKAAVTVHGRTTDRSVSKVEMKVYREEALVGTRQTSATGTWTLSAPITAERASYSVEVWAERSSGKTLLRRADDIVAGDGYVIQGQSNAAAAGWNYSGTAASQDLSPWVRTFGYSTPNPALSTDDRSWYRASGDGRDTTTTSVRGAIGELGVRLGQDLVNQSGIPVAIFNGAHGGQPSTFFKRSPSAPADPATNYGRLLQRVTAAGLKDAVRAVIWYQGESDTGLSGKPTAAQHNANVRALMASWRTDFTHLEHVYVVQIRNHCGALHSAAVQEVQRRFASIPGTSVMTTMGLDGHNGCHYTYEHGYRQLADRLTLPIRRDLYGAHLTTPADPPNPARAAWNNTAHTSIRIYLTDPTQKLHCDAGTQPDFTLYGTAAKVAQVTCGTGYLLLNLTRPGTGLTGITYFGHPGTATPTSAPVTPWITNDSGMGLLAFDRLPTTEPSTNPDRQRPR
ncbi:sialate O-acetylesterase [Streptomyces sp. NPDC007205]|uniref:sialate O-acetylesterase n=1 Tax=Streptomyces sp. NPDC007205 TaxID=3154316 RepID=UPI0033D01765